MRRLILPVLLGVITLLLLFRASNPVMAVGFGVLIYSGIAIMRQAITAIRTGELMLPRRYGLNFYYTGMAAVAQGWLRAGIGMILIAFALTLGYAALT